jgi:hypothetical protein
MLSTVDLLVRISLDKLLFYKKNINHGFNTSYLNEEAKCTEPSPSVRLPCKGYTRGPPPHRMVRRATEEIRKKILITYVVKCFNILP